MSTSSVGSACRTNQQNRMVDTLLFEKETLFLSHFSVGLCPADCQICAIYLLISYVAVHA